LDPYRPAVTSQLEEASNVAMVALMPAIEEIDNLVSAMILRPMCRALNHLVATKMGRMHLEGAYILQSTMDSSEMGASSFVQKNLTGLYESLSALYLAKLPPRYSILVGSAVSTFSVFTFVSNASLIRPLSEDAKLHLTQDLADFELVVEQFMTRAGGNIETKALSEIGNGKAYAELRAMRQMLFWTGLDDTSKPAGAVVKSLLREVWARDMRPSTIFHYLFSYAPNLLSSPHHWKRMRADEYVGTLVTLDGDVEEGESVDWMTTMQCCDSYQQRESAQSSLPGKTGSEGDPRIASILTALGPELLRRRR
jgi:conserved oligomeric Golgi complex subunit 5